jgi:hypothetical protein
MICSHLILVQKITMSCEQNFYDISVINRTISFTVHYIVQVVCLGKSTGKIQPRTGHEGTDGE